MPDPSTPIKPRKPTPKYRLRAHANGKFYKWSKNGLLYFGRWNDPDGADAEYEAYLNYLKGPQTPPADTVTVVEIADRFILHQEDRYRRGEIGLRQFDDCRRLSNRFAAAFPAELRGAELSPQWLERYRESLPRLDAVTLQREMKSTAAMLYWAYRTGLLKSDLSEDPALRRPAKRQVRREQRQKNRVKPLFKCRECRLLLACARQPIESMILLALNGGFTQVECAELPASALDLRRGLLSFARPKTEVLRDVTLWPETVEALTEWIAQRPEPANPADADLVFLTARGNRWVRDSAPDVNSPNPTDTRKRVGKLTHFDAVPHEFKKLCKLAGIERNGRGFACLRKTFRTIAEGINVNPKRLNAIRRIMGHELAGMDPHYMRHMPRKRLKKITDYVRHRVLVSELNVRKPERSPRRGAGAGSERTPSPQQSPSAAAETP